MNATHAAIATKGLVPSLIKRDSIPARERIVFSQDVMNWVTQTFEAGHSVVSMLDCLVNSGWPIGDAKEALRCILCKDPIPTPALVSSAPLPKAVPEPASLQSPCIELDRKVRILLSVRHPRIVLFGDLLSARECSALIDMARNRMERSRTMDEDSGAEVVHEARTSRGMFFNLAENDVVARIERRIAALLNWPLDRGEALQILYYGPGAEYKPHFDYFPMDKTGTASILKRGGQRVGSLVMYLNEPESGGGTVFPDAGVEIHPHRGNAVFFSYDRPDPETGTRHGGAPVLSGEKWVATKWLRERQFA